MAERKKRIKNEQLKLIERLVAILPANGDGARDLALHLRERIRNPIAVILAKVPGDTVEEKCRTGSQA